MNSIIKNLRIGNGFDVHKFVNNRDLILAGVKIDNYPGLAGHSDADVLLHSIIDSLLGALNLGDIGVLFPDTDKKYKDISSLKLLKDVNDKIKSKKIDIINIDSIVICEKPKISPFINEMKKNISGVLDNLDINRIGIKGKTTEKLGFTGREEGIAVHSVVLILLP